MYLYDKNGDRIDVYSLVPNKERIYNYRKECMELVPSEERLFKAVGINYLALDYGRPIDFNGYKVERVKYLPENKVNKKWSFFTRGYHSLSTYEMVGYEYARQKHIIEGYCLGNIVGNKIVAITSENVSSSLEYLRYLLISSYYYVGYNQESVLNNIISIPKELFLLEWCLFGGSFDSLSDEEFRKVIKLFDLSEEPVDMFDYDRLIQYRNYGLIDESDEILASRIDERVIQSSGTLRRIREKY